MSQGSKYCVIGVLGSLILTTLGVGLYFKHYFVVFVFGVWLFCEFAIRWLSVKSTSEVSSTHGSSQRSSILFPLEAFYKEWSPSSLMLLDEETSQLKRDAGLSLTQRKKLDQFCELIELKRLLTCSDLKGKRALRQMYCYQVGHAGIVGHSEGSLETDTLQDMTESAVLVARLYRKAMEAALSEDPILSENAKILLEKILGGDFDAVSFQNRIEALSDQMQRDGGLPFLLLNLLHLKQWSKVKNLATRLLTSNIEAEEETRSALYWLTEIDWFSRSKNEPINEYDVMIRYLYHICFTNPERAAFLEIDSQFFSQFETVNELSREAFLFKETLIEKFLELWREQEGLFESTFQGVFEILLGKQSKIFDERNAWERLWLREKEDFSKDYLYVVEGNICYAVGHYEDAKNYYEKALKLNPRLRSALLNSVFAYAKLKKTEIHERAVSRLVEEPSLYPSSLYVAGNSYLLMGMETKSEQFYKSLQKVPGWEGKTDYYRSTFCFENGLYEKALLFARLAHESNTRDSSILYHLSLCYNAVGEKERALEAVKHVADGPQWLDYYKFTLERDSGRHAEASKTLSEIPSDYFEDPEELEAALEFAKESKDLTLLRRLRKR